MLVQFDAIAAIKAAVQEYNSTGEKVVREGGGLKVECQKGELTAVSQVNRGPADQFIAAIRAELFDLGFTRLVMRKVLVTTVEIGSGKGPSLTDEWEWTVTAYK